MMLTMQALLLSLLLLPCPLPLQAASRNMQEETLSDWVNAIRWMQPGVTIFDQMTPGDSLGLDCRGMAHMTKIQVPLTLQWRIHNRPLTDEGPTGRVHLLEDNGRLTVENVNERDSGLYSTYASTSSLTRVLDLSHSRNDSSTAGAAGSTQSIGDLVAVCMFVVRVNKLRLYAMREGENFAIEASSWLTPFADTLDALSMPQEEWKIAWYRDGEDTVSCQSLTTCGLNFSASRDLTIGIWSLELRSLVDVKGQRRVLLEFSMTVLPPLAYLETFPLATHQYYMVYGSLMIALCLLSLHLFNNLNWTPFAFDVLPDQVSPKAVLDQAGVFLKETRV